MVTKSKRSETQSTLSCVNVNWQVKMENRMKFPQKVKSKNYRIIQQSYYWIFIQKKENQNIENIHIQVHIHCYIIHNRQDTETTQVSINRWTDKDVAFVYNGILFGYEEYEILPFAKTWVDLEGDMLWNKLNREKTKMILLHIESFFFLKSNSLKQNRKVAGGWGK